MKSYDNTDNFRNREHVIRITFQSEEYKGHIAYKVQGNCQGINVMDFDVDYIDEDDISRFIENDCNFRLNDDCETFSMTLTDLEGNECLFEYEESNDIGNKIVAIEIVDCKIKKVN
ncbi:DUF5406 family protein [Clostridium sp. UBA2485]|uniref:DUF5406 family protein n=1 Tax=Clostridium sp. UBA2485 TaxID=1946352 RepID=UPI0025BB7971|nr:DUF5406 family protein [Clostridium sp. UBA2485]